jgi:Raf kinase inhibitor-like YbhB/YbcL family protein
MKLTSPVFQMGEEIPRRFSCEGESASPPLSWSEAPPETRSFALICEDPDAPLVTFVHWVLYDLPASASELGAGVPGAEVFPFGAKQGKNGYGRVGYGAPCPPTGPFHRYYFSLYALVAMLGLPGGASKKEVEGAMQGHVLAQAQLMGRYRKVKLRTFLHALTG